MPWIIGTIVSGGLGYLSSSNAADASADASRQAVEENRRQFDLVRDDTAQARDVGRQALNQLTYKVMGRDVYDDLEMDPGYAFRLAEGEKARQRQQSAGGTRYGGGALKAAMRYGQDYASGEFSNAVNRRNSELGYLFSLAGFGEQGIATAGQAGASAAANNSNILMQNAQMQGNYGMQGASAINNAVQGGMQNYYTQQLLRDYNRPPPPTSTSNYGSWA